MNLSRLKIEELLMFLASGRCSATDLLHANFHRMKHFSHLGAFISTIDEDGLAKAEKRLERSKLVYGRRRTRRGAVNSYGNAFHSIPFAVKDNFCSKDYPTTCASRILQNYRPPFSATVVEKSQSNGAVLFGKTNMDEFAMGSGAVDSVFGPVLNPYNVNHIAGGSSGGGAVAVATGMVSYSIGSDTAGSVRTPAAYCGVVGFRPTYGTLSRFGLIPLVNSMDCPGIFSRHVVDVAYVYEFLQGHDKKGFNKCM